MATDIVIPNVGESVTNGVIASWTVRDGEYADRDQTVLELETDKITMEVPAPVAGIVHHGAAEGDTVDVGATVGTVDETAEAPVPVPAGAAADAPSTASASEAPSASTPSVDVEPETNGDVRATPLARKVASELGVDLSRVVGTGAGQRIREQDVRAFVEQEGPAQSAAGASTQSEPQSTSPAALPTPGTRAVRVEAMTPLRQRIATRLVAAQQTAAMLTTFNEIDMSAVMNLRTRHKEAFKEKHGIGLGFMSFFVRAVTNALEAFPAVNAFIVDDEDGSPAIEFHDYCDVSIAVSSPKGLVVPVLRSAESMSFAAIERTIKDLAIRARDNRLTLDDLTGGTFTITNGGVFGSLMSTPILNPPQSAILGMHAIKNRAIEDPDNPGQPVIRPMMYVALSYDHRIIDGAEAVSFLVAIKEAVEDPARLMLDL